jgi:hypothetical protein
MDFLVWQGGKRRHSCSYGNDEQHSQTRKSAIYTPKFSLDEALVFAQSYPP